MKKIHFASALVLSLAFSLVGSRVYGTFEDKSMRGIDSIYIAIENINPDIKNEGFNEQTVRRDVELKLRSAGIKIIGENEWLNLKGRPYLLIAPIVKEISPNNYVYKIKMRIRQEARLIRNPSLVTFCTTWDRESFGTSSSLSYIRKDLEYLVDDFLDVWLSVNP